ncbi:AMP-binding enzyme [Nakamurella sp. GG22]
MTPATSAEPPGLRLGGAGDRRAITADGVAVTYGALAELIAAQRQLIADRDGPVSATGLPVIDCLALVFAAAFAGRAVLIADPAGVIPQVHVVPDGTFLIAVTSGTSGAPRPVLRTAASWTWSFAPFGLLTGIGPDDRVLLTGPLHATLHLFAAVHALSVGAEITDRQQDATVTHAVPARLAGLLSELPVDAPLRTVVVAGAVLPDRLAEQAVARGMTLIEYYGAAELSFVAARRYPEPLTPFPGAEVQIRNGTLWVRSPYLSTGYPKGRSGPLRRDDDGFATVGDLADPLPGGGLLIRGRGDSAVTTGGATVLAEDVERALGSLPQVSAVAVVGVPHATLGEVLTAVVEPRPGADLTGIRDAARALLKGHSLPRRWLVADRLPRTPSGKIARHPVALAAARWARDGSCGAHSPPEEVPGLRPLP